MRDTPRRELRPWQLVQFRAIENRVAMEAEHCLDSAIIDPTGDVLASTDDDTELGSSALLVRSVHLGGRDSPFLKLGDWVGLLLIAGAIVVVGTQISSSRPARRTAQRRRAVRLARPGPSSDREGGHHDVRKGTTGAVVGQD